jgi:hypothetical protein
MAEITEQRTHGPGKAFERGNQAILGAGHPALAIEQRQCLKSSNGSRNRSPRFNGVSNG